MHPVTPGICHEYYLKPISTKTKPCTKKYSVFLIYYFDKVTLPVTDIVNFTRINPFTAREIWHVLSNTRRIHFIGIQKNLIIFTSTFTFFLIISNSKLKNNLIPRSMTICCEISRSWQRMSQVNDLSRHRNKIFFNSTREIKTFFILFI